MKDNTKLNFTLQGVTEHDGEVDVIDEKQEDVNAIMAFTFKEKNDEAYTFGMSAIGGFSIKYYSQIIQHIIQAIGRNKFVEALLLAEIASKMDNKDEFAGGALIHSLIPTT